MKTWLTSLDGNSRPVFNALIRQHFVLPTVRGRCVFKFLKVVYIHAVGFQHITLIDESLRLMGVLVFVEDDELRLSSRILLSA